MHLKCHNILILVCSLIVFLISYTNESLLCPSIVRQIFAKALSKSSKEVCGKTAQHG